MLASLPARTAFAVEPDEAQRLFDKGMEMMEAGKFGAACPAIERSHTLDPRPGTLFTLAECEAKRGRIARAYARYDEYLELYAGLPADKKAKQGDRPKVARAARDALAKRVPTLKIVLPAKMPAGMSVERDDTPLDPGMGGLAVPVEPGSHTVAASAPGMKPWVQTIDVPEGASIVVVVPALDTPAPRAPVVTLAPLPKPVVAPATSDGSTQRVLGGVVAGVGAAGVIVGSVLGMMAKSRWNQVVETGRCKPDFTGCDLKAKGKVDELASSAGSLADGSTASFVVGGAAIVTGIVVLVTAPSAKKETASAWRVAPLPVQSGVGGALERRF